MYSVSFIVIFVILAIAAGFYVLHPPQRPATESVPRAAAVAIEPSIPSSDRPGPDRIEIDLQAHAISFVIEGKKVAWIDADGLHVRGDIEYGGVLKDAGADKLQRSGVRFHPVEGREGP